MCRRLSRSIAECVRLFVISYFLLCGNSYAEDVATCLKGVCFGDQKKVGNELLPLTSRCRGTYLFFDVFDGGYYVDAKDRDLGRLSPEYSRALELYYHRSIDAQDFVEGALKSLKANPNVLLANISEGVAAMHAAYQSVQEGDRYELLYDSQKKETCLVRDGQQKACVLGEEFMQAYFSIWLSPTSIDEECTRKLLSRE